VGVEANPLDVEDLRARVQKQLDAFLTEQAQRLDDIDEDLAPLMDALAGLLAGGKRLRPAFCWWGWRGAGGDDTDDAVLAATSLELLQACALIHDDVMDASDTRRGQPAAHRRLAALHGSAGWAGSPEAFGVGAAILLGDLCLSWADELLERSRLPRLAAARPVYDVMRTELMAGQYLDLLEQARGGGSVERALRVVRYKSAKYTVERPLHLGITLAGGGSDLRAAASAYALPLGEAFQLRDDVLGVFGDPDETGKPAGDDLREGKRTVLVALALESASPAQAAVVTEHLGDPALGAPGVAALREVLTETGALSRVEALIADLTEDALSALAHSCLSPSSRAVLADLAVAATARRG
jgi:geranylgeranyl diphosphate synthase type I